LANGTETGGENRSPILRVFLPFVFGYYLVRTGPHPGRTESPVISCKEVGYVRRSGAARLAAIPVGASPTNRGVQSLL
jgi:hypothetical protein